MASVVKVVEVMSESEKSWEDAVLNAVKRTARTIHGIKSVYVDNFTAKVEGDRIVEYRVDAKISFVLDEPEADGRASSVQATTTAGRSGT
jgi:flavin-binding protein dodecin